MNKRLTALVLTLGLALALTACARADTPVELPDTQVPLSGPQAVTDTLVISVDCPGWQEGDIGPLVVIEGLGADGGLGAIGVEPGHEAEAATLGVGSYHISLVAPILADGTMFAPVAGYYLSIGSPQGGRYAHHFTLIPLADSQMTTAALEAAAAALGVDEAHPAYVAAKARIEAAVDSGQSAETGTAPGPDGTEPSTPSGAPAGSGSSGSGGGAGTSPGPGSGSSGGGGGPDPHAGQTWHPAWTEEVWHDEVGHYGAICNTCGQEIPPPGSQHLLETGHDSYRGPVWFVDAPGWMEYIHHEGYWS
jgi:hypothetical protein